MTNSQRVVQSPPKPRFRNVPPAPASDAQRAIDLAAHAGLELDPWQCDVLAAALGVRPDGRWAADEVAVIVPRQNGKGSVLEAAELYWLFLADDRLITHTAHRFDTCKDHFKRVRQLVESTPALSKRLRPGGIRVANGDESIELKDGTRLAFKARSKGSGRGFSGDKVVLDEAFYLWDEALAAMLPTLSARPNPQVWYTSSSPVDGPESEVLRRLCKRGRAGDPSLAYVEFSAGDDADLDDVAVWHEANPSLGLRLQVSAVELERRSLTDEAFAVERLGVWREDAGPESLIPPEDWNACGGSVPVADPVTFGVEVGRMLDGAAVVAAGAAGNAVGVEVIEHRDDGVDWLIPRILELDAKWNPRGFVVDPRSQAGRMLLVKEPGGYRPVDELADVNVIACDTADLVAATSGMFRAIKAHQVQHRSDPHLDEAVKVAQQRDVGDSWLWHRGKSGVPIWSLVAATLARWGHLLPEEEPAGFIGVEWR